MMLRAWSEDHHVILDTILGVITVPHTRNSSVFDTVKIRGELADYVIAFPSVEEAHSFVAALTEMDYRKIEGKYGVPVLKNFAGDYILSFSPPAVTHVSVIFR